MPRKYFAEQNPYSEPPKLFGPSFTDGLRSQESTPLLEQRGTLADLCAGETPDECIDRWDIELPPGTPGDATINPHRVLKS